MGSKIRILFQAQDASLVVLYLYSCLSLNFLIADETHLVRSEVRSARCNLIKPVDYLQIQ
jgi:hypothetical protein